MKVEPLGDHTPNPASLVRAQAFIDSLVAVVKANGLLWVKPHTTVQGADDDVTFEWWKGDLYLSVYADANETVYLEGTAGRGDMTEGDAESPEQQLRMWRRMGFGLAPLTAEQERMSRAQPEYGAAMKASINAPGGITCHRLHGAV